MGFFDKDTRQRVISNASLFFNESINVEEVVGIMYDNLLQGYLPEKLQLKALLEVCRRGWEYFSFLICRMIKIVKNINNIASFNLS